ncbi:hypothetical protein D9M72_519040 [compost metagenome]
MPVGDFLAAVLPLLHLHHFRAVEIDDDDVRLADAATDVDLDFFALNLRLDGNGKPLAFGLHCLQPRFDRLKIAAVDMVAPVQDRLGRIDAIATEHPGIGILPFGIFLGGQCVGPTEIVPVVDMVGERHDITAIDKRLQRRISRRAGGTALAGE